MAVTKPVLAKRLDLDDHRGVSRHDTGEIAEALIGVLDDMSHLECLSQKLFGGTTRRFEDDQRTVAGGLSREGDGGRGQAIEEEDLGTVQRGRDDLAC